MLERFGVVEVDILPFSSGCGTIWFKEGRGKDKIGLGWTEY